MKRIIGMDGKHELTTWVDAPHAVHHDMKRHTGDVISLGYGLVHQKSGKQKLNTKSSTESEIVGASDYLPWNIWMTCFMKGQGYKVKKHVFMQYKESAIKLEINGKKSSSGKTRHTKIRYYFVTDVVKREALAIQYCPTGIVFADLYRKSLQGNLFKKFRSAIMGHTALLTEERAVNSDNGNSADAGRTNITVSNDDASNHRTYAQVVMCK